MTSSSIVQSNEAPAHQRSGLILFAPSPEAAEWRYLIERQAHLDGVPTFAAGAENVAHPCPFAVYLSDDLNDLGSASYDEVTVILTQADALGYWTGADRVQASLALSALPAAKHGVEYITPSKLTGARRIDILSFLSIDLTDGAPTAVDAQRDQALSIYREGPPQPGSVSLWVPGAFIIDPNHQTSSSGDVCIDLAGRARCLVHGPYVTLPAGQWKATVRFTVDAAASLHRFRFEWGGQTDFTSFEASPGKPGHFRAELNHAISQSGLSEFRLILPESSLAGALTFAGVDIELCGDTTG